MKWLHQNTTIPVPEIIDSVVTIDSPIGVPYILMRRMPGKTAQNVWYDEPANRNHITANGVSPKTEKKCITILRSLVQHMAKFQTLGFSKIGLVDCIDDAMSSDAPPAVTVSYR
jgi:hypothetical protein